eukprot:5665_1
MQRDEKISIPPDTDGKVNKRKRTAKQANIDDSITEQDLELKEFECPRCDQKFNSTTALYIHMRNQYTNPTNCHVCGKNLNALPNILSHSYIHKNIKPYKCPTTDCKYQSRTRYNLKVHLASCAGIEKFRAAKRKKTKKIKMRSNPMNDITTQYNMDMPPPLLFQSGDISFNPTIIMHNPYGMNDTPPLPPPPEIKDEIQDSGPFMDESRDDTFLIVLHKDYIPPQSSTCSPLYSTDALYSYPFQPQCTDEYTQYMQYIDSFYYAPML